MQHADAIHSPHCRLSSRFLSRASDSICFSSCFLLSLFASSDFALKVAAILALAVGVTPRGATITGGQRVAAGATTNGLVVLVVVVVVVVDRSVAAGGATAGGTAADVTGADS